MKKLFCAILCSMSLWGLGCSSLPSRPDIEGQYYAAQSMVQYVIPDETAELATEFLASNPEPLEWGTISLYDKIANWLNQFNWEYQKDPSFDLWRSPANTIENEGGDCEDGAILIASLLLELGCPNKMALVLVRLPSGGLHVYLSIQLQGNDFRIESFPYFVTPGLNGEVLREAAMA